MNTKRIAAVVLVLIGIIAVILGISAYSLDTGYNESDKEYGGDAYTGIQNAAAQTARNTVYLTEAVAFVGGSILLIAGLALIGSGIATWPEEEYNPVSYQTPAQSVPQQSAPRYSAPVPQTHQSAVANWTCTCGAVNPDYVSVCNCGVTKQQARQKPVVDAAPKQPPVRTANGWRCSCGKEYPNYISSCPCGVNKSDIC